MGDWTVRPSAIDTDVAHLGTRFLVFPQPPFIPGYERPEVVWISSPPGSIGPGPASSRFYTTDPKVPKEPYQYPYLPPFFGLEHPPAEAGLDGHFDHLPLGSRQFLAAHVFACTHRVLDIAENYAGATIPWFFAPTYDRLEIIPHLRWDNAQSGYGFLEMGEDTTRGEAIPFALNFDAIAHEVGHLILFGALGMPQNSAVTRHYLGYHEAIADFISLVGLLHFDSALDKILRRTRGNLLLVNELDRFAELGDEKQVRSMSHALKMWDVGDEVHDLSKPFAGALFDSLIEIFQIILVERGLSDLNPREVEEVRLQMSPDNIEINLSVNAVEYEHRHFSVKSALIEARDLMGETVAQSWFQMSANGMTYRDAAEALLIACEAGRSRRFADRLHGNFVWRGIL